MRFKYFAIGLVLVAVAVGMFVVSAQEPGDDDVRGAFLSTRPKTTNANAPARRRRTTHNTNSNSSSNTPKNDNSTTTANANSSRPHNSNSGRGASQAIGLGYTLYLRANFTTAIACGFRSNRTWTVTYTFLISRTTARRT